MKFQQCQLKFNKGCLVCPEVEENQIILTKILPDEQITATKSHAETAAPKYARLNTKDGAGAWCHPYIDREDDQQYLQVKYHLDDLRTSLNVCFHNISLTGELR